mmetsp:Transcript_15894/g.62107  ORF Transcript_15894/g.62107 Transcript_15894/m.62107 type:complete len:351 (+) Transcript_15894:249-1301(+)|eukprot:CAMPEP_0114626850 /NCGR_PEP_ID=MMETSP0168-20121206/11995_1 /TAXON_ID=95228 ORGANISM="Vannella sp., Strain DIVA3 517/6/12" /NCGR_SAMPLE_ID=MMETSP0168 /ASSEMBLY_ACC=CAM_ASM_000044 /LENGTH=350 /DNA_ID=CAMNT_0001838169 /DNA_START=160 /DNA_END=1212 /DNA_ORIENTATION=+
MALISDLRKAHSLPFLPDSQNEGHFFEGAEKRLEIDFNFIEGCQETGPGLRSIRRAQWDHLLSKVNCLIMSVRSNEYLDMYVLSESSLFVYPKKVMIKTCGTTTLLHCVPTLLQYAKSVNLEVDHVTYSHKNFERPERQLAPYSGDFTEEVGLLNKWFDGQGYVLGPLNGDRWFIYVADVTKLASSPDEVEQTVEILMSDLNPKAMKMFFKSDLSGPQVTRMSGIDTLIPGSTIDEQLFDPCGYSMNSFLGAHYSTIHITPENEFSYVSFEANVPVASYDKLVSAVLEIFRPGRFVLSVFADRSAICGPSSEAVSTRMDGYSLKCKTTCDFDGRRSVTCSHYATAQAVIR